MDEKEYERLYHLLDDVAQASAQVQRLDTTAWGTPREYLVESVWADLERAKERLRENRLAVMSYVRNLLENNDPELMGECDTCGSDYDTSSRDGRCGDCGNCATCCDHNEGEE